MTEDAITRQRRGNSKVAVHVRSTPGLIVNRIARPCYAEALVLLQERAATPAVVALLEGLFAAYRSERYRVSPLLQRLCWESELDQSSKERPT